MRQKMEDSFRPKLQNLPMVISVILLVKKKKKKKAMRPVQIEGSEKSLNTRRLGS
jgi:hypothetical protein